MSCFKSMDTEDSLYQPYAPGIGIPYAILGKLFAEAGILAELAVPFTPCILP